MLKHTFAGSFKKDLTLLEKRRWNTTKLRDVMDLIIAERPLPPERKDHPLRGSLKDYRECHIQGDWVLVYELDPADRSVTFNRTGTHSDLFKK
ncbi:addiction module toxin, RelE/StbE family [Spirochaetia bacterium]|nr:addiction module toxin, RelE/StbE family [Spirochaetia bacterium]